MYLNSAFLKGVGRYGRPGRRDLWHPDSSINGHGAALVRGGDKMKKRLVEWLIRKLLPGFHLHRDPVRKTDLSKVIGTGSPLDDFTSPPPEFSTDGGKNEI